MTDGKKPETQEKCFACCYPNEEICHGPAFGCIADDYTALSNAAVQARISALEASLIAAQKENDTLRVLASQVKCVYGHRSESGVCNLGYPGCACMDDLMVAEERYPEDTQGAALKRLKERAEKAEQALALRGEPPGRKKTSLDEDFGEYVLRNLMLACSHWSSSRNVDGTMNLAESELAAAFEARAREGIKELAAAVSGERVREATEQNARDWPEDGERYQNVCATCRNVFIGNKRRVACKVCALPLAAIQGETNE